MGASGPGGVCIIDVRKTCSFPQFVPSGELTYSNGTDGPVEIVDFPMKNGGSFHCYVNVHQAGYVDSLIQISRVSTGVATDPLTLDVDDVQIVKEGGFFVIWVCLKMLCTPKPNG